MKQMLTTAMILGMLAGCAKAAPKAQPAKQGETQAQSENKVWLDNFETAKAKSKASGLPIFAFFTGSDWCGWCIKLHKEVLDQTAFKNFAAANFVLFEADFPQRKKLTPEVEAQNKALSDTYKVRDFPTIFLLDAEGKTLGQTGYQAGGANAYVAHLKNLLEVANVAVKAAKETPAE